MCRIHKAKPEDYQEIKEFEAQIFNIEDDDLILPKLFVGRPESTEHFWMIKEQGKIVATVGSLPEFMNMNSHILKVRAIGYVAVDPSYRSKGYMKLLMEKAIDEAKHDGTHMMILAGQRQRYQYFGFGHNNAYVELNITPVNLRHVKTDDSCKVTLEPIDEKNLQFCHELN